MAIHVKGGRNVVQPLAVEETSPSVSAHHPFTLPAGSHRAGITEVSRTRLLPLEGGGRRAMSCVAVVLHNEPRQARRSGATHPRRGKVGVSDASATPRPVTPTWERHATWPGHGVRGERHEAGPSRWRSVLPLRGGGGARHCGVKFTRNRRETPRFGKVIVAASYPRRVVVALQWPRSPHGSLGSSWEIGAAEVSSVTAATHQLERTAAAPCNVVRRRQGRTVEMDEPSGQPRAARSRGGGSRASPTSNTVMVEATPFSQMKPAALRAGGEQPLH